MSTENKITKKQHYVPQVYLRGFSPEYHKGNKDLPLSKYTIYCHDLTARDQIMKAVPIKSICYNNYLYEVTGYEGEIVLPNYLEKILSAFEKMFGNFRYELERKVYIEDNYKTKCFLANKEKVFWVTYILVQILRSPQILKLAESVSLETWGDQTNTMQAQNIARMSCLPFFKPLEEDSKEAVLFYTFLKPMLNMSFGVGVDRQAKIVTSDNPVFIYSRERTNKEYSKVIFPITSEICLFLFGNEYKEQYPKNFLFPIKDEDREEIFKSITKSSQQKIYSNHMLDKKERRFVKEVRKCKEER